MIDYRPVTEDDLARLWAETSQHEREFIIANPGMYFAWAVGARVALYHPRDSASLTTGTEQ